MGMLDLLFFFKLRSYIYFLHLFKWIQMVYSWLLFESFACNNSSLIEFRTYYNCWCAVNKVKPSLFLYFHIGKIQIYIYFLHFYFYFKLYYFQHVNSWNCFCLHFWIFLKYFNILIVKRNCFYNLNNQNT